MLVFRNVPENLSSYLQLPDLSPLRSSVDDVKAMNLSDIAQSVSSLIAIACDIILFSVF